jgi:excisionase family DNA binding protein
MGRILEKVEEAPDGGRKLGQYNATQNSQLERALYDLSTASRVMSVGRTTLYMMIRKGELRVCRAGRRVLLPAREIERWVAHQLGDGDSTDVN